MGMRQALGEGPFSLAESRRQEQRDDAVGRVGDAGERSDVKQTRQRNWYRKSA
jgi:hypothetical protein